jgi:rapamycin-insensitive companion of mTOR
MFILNWIIVYQPFLVLTKINNNKYILFRVLLGRVLSCSQQKSRLYATRFLRILLRFNAHRAEDVVVTGFWILELLISQTADDNPIVSMAALDALDEACDYNV